MAGSSSDLHSVSQIWLTVQQLKSLSLPDLPGTERGIRKHMENKVATNSSARRHRDVGKGFEYRADILSIHAQKALLELSSEGIELPDTDHTDILSSICRHSGNLLFSSTAEMVDDGLNLLSVLNRFIASDGDFVRDDLSRALDLAEGLIRAGHALSKTEGGAA